jgi:hypothetical protein
VKTALEERCDAERLEVPLAFSELDGVVTALEKEDRTGRFRVAAVRQGVGGMAAGQQRDSAAVVDAFAVFQQGRMATAIEQCLFTHRGTTVRGMRRWRRSLAFTTEVRVKPHGVIA